MKRIVHDTILALYLAAAGFPALAAAQQSANDGSKIAGNVVSAMKTNTKGLSAALGDGISYAFAFIGLVMCVVGFYQLFFAEGSKIKAIYVLIGAFACLGLGGVVAVFLTG